MKKWIVVILNRKGGLISEIFGMRTLYVPGSSTRIKVCGEAGLTAEIRRNKEALQKSPQPDHPSGLERPMILSQLQEELGEMMSQ